MDSRAFTKNNVLAAVTELLGKKHGSVGYLAKELGICPQAVSRWQPEKLIPRVHRFHLRVNRPDLIEILQAGCDKNSSANEAA